jgi:glutamine cyclotransferase
LIVYDVVDERGITVFEAPADVFLEGCTVIDDNRALVLSWREYKLFEFSLPSFELVKIHEYPYEGWGIAYDPNSHQVYTTDGSSKLYKMDPQTLKVNDNCDVKISHDGVTYRSVPYLNELEYIDGLVYANMYIPAGLKDSPNYIVGIDPEDCLVKRIIPLFGFKEHRGDQGNVMNGITEYPPRTGEMMITGKTWNKIFHVKVHDLSEMDPRWARNNITRFIDLDIRFR